MIRRFLRNLTIDLNRQQRLSEANKESDRYRQRKPIGYSDQTPIGFRSRAHSSYFIR